MRRTLLFLTLIMLGWLGKVKGAELPYSFNFTDQTAFDTDWTVLNLNADEQTWHLVTGEEAAQYRWNSAQAADDWMIAPVFHLEAGTDYKLSYQLKTSSASNKENVKVMLGRDKTPEAMTRELAKYEEYANIVYVKEEKIFTVEETGDYYIGFYCYSAKDRYAVFIKDFSLKVNGLIPSPVTELTVVPDPDQELKATLSWTNPSLDVSGKELPDTLSAGIYRNEEEIAVVTGLTKGAVFSWTDEQVPEAGLYTYGVEIRLKDEKSELVSVESGWIGQPIPAQEIPYSYDFSDQTDFDHNWVVINANEDNKTWTLDTDKKRAKYTYNGSMAADDWMITPPLHLEAGTEYKISYLLMTGNFDEKLEVMLGREPTAAAMTVELGRYEPFRNTEGEKKIVTTTVEESGTYYIGFHCISDKNKYYLYVSDFSIKQNVPVPVPVSQFQVTAAADESLSATLSWTNPTVDTDGLPLNMPLTAAVIYRDSIPVGTVDSPVSGENSVWTDRSVPAPGFYIYRVEVTLGQAKSAGVEIVSPWIGPLEAVALPYRYDFEDPVYFGIWKVVPSEGAAESWILYKDGANRTVRYAGTENAVADDWLKMPPVEFETGNYYRLKYELKGNGNCRVTLSGPGVTENQPRVLDEMTGFAQSTFEPKEIVIPATESGRYQIGWQAFGAQEAGWRLDLDNVSVEKMRILPAHVQDLTVTPDADRLKRAVLTWTNPSLTNVGTPLIDLTAVEIYRNGERIGSVADVQVGAAASYTDSIIPEPGTYRYQVVPVGTAGPAEGEPLEVVSAWIGGGASLPYAMEFSPEEDFSVWTVIDRNSDGKTWEIYKDGTNYYAHYKGVYRDADEWLITPPLDMTADKFYRITYQVKGKGHESYKVTIGKSNTAEAQTTVIGDYPTFSSMDFTDGTEFVSVAESGMYFIAWQAYSRSGEWNVDIDQVKIEEVAVLPVHVQDLAVTPASDKSLTAVLTWTNPASSNVGAPLASLTAVYIYRNEEMIGTIENPQPGAVETFTDDRVPAAGPYVYKVIPENASGLPEGDPIEVGSGWVGGGVALPYEVNFLSDDDIAFWTLRDANGDGKEWTRNASKNQMEYSSYKPADDWLITVPLDGVSGVHKISFAVKTGVGYGSVPSEFDFTFGGSADPADHDTILATYPEYQSGLFEELSTEFSIYTDTVFYIGLHLKTNVNNNGEMFYVNNFKAERTGPLVGIADITAVDGIVYNRPQAWLRVPENAGIPEIFTIQGIRISLSADRQSVYDLSSLPTGLYLVKVRMNTGKESVFKIMR